MNQGRFTTKAWLILLGIIALTATIGMLLLQMPSPPDRTLARIYQDGRLIHEINLKSVHEEYSFVIAAPQGGENMIHVRSGGICISSADCTDNTCVKQGWLTHGITPIVCLPHRLVIQLEQTVNISFDAMTN